MYMNRILDKVCSNLQTVMTFEYMYNSEVP